MDDNRIDSFDDLFEPFDLEGEPPPDEPVGRVVTAGPTVICPSCGTHNSPQNRHCEACGARISQGPLPVAPQPVLRTTPGARALGILAVVLFIVVALAFVVNQLRDSGDETGGTQAQTSSTTTTSLPTLAIEPLRPTRVEASSSLTGFAPSALIDDDATNYWNDNSARGVGAELEFFFAQPVQINSIVIQNVKDEEKFKLNYRIEGYEIEFDDLPLALEIGRLDDTRDPQTIEVGTVATTKVTLRVTSTYPGETFNNKSPFNELALQEVKFFGRVADS